MFEIQKNKIILSVLNALKTNKNPCKNYKTEKFARRVGQLQSELYGKHFDSIGGMMNFSVVLVPSWGRYVISFDMTEMMKRDTFMGGCITQPNFDGFYTH
ncbi:MAG: hypothetical protein [Caudoviricetes sp.]|nr:MAG: hypothetical protein [Caudoviricetes sp.]